MPHRHYGMYSDDGDNAVHRIVTAALRLPMTTSNADLYRYLTKRMNALSPAHGEVWDTEVRSCIIGAIERATKRDLTIYW